MLDLFFKKTKDLSGSNTPTVAVTTAIQLILDIFATQTALST